MADKNKFFCGGLLFNLLLEARCPRISKKAAMKNGREGLAETDVMSGLVSIVDPGDESQGGSDAYKYENTFKKNTSEYKTCKYSGGMYIPFDNAVTLRAFDTSVQGSYQTVLKRMMDFVSCFIDRSKMDWLVKALLDVFLMEGIDDMGSLFVSMDGQRTMKKDLFNLPRIEFQPFLLGVLHYVLMDRQDNTIGRRTYEQWYQSAAKGKPVKYVGDLGVRISKTPPVIWLESPAISEPDENPANQDGPLFEEEAPKERDPPEEEDAGSGQASVQMQIINNPTIVNQYGDKNAHIDHVDTLIL